jgi:hypothetical protein
MFTKSYIFSWKYSKISGKSRNQSVIKFSVRKDEVIFRKSNSLFEAKSTEIFLLDVPTNEIFHNVAIMFPIVIVQIRILQDHFLIVSTLIWRRMCINLYLKGFYSLIDPYNKPVGLSSIVAIFQRRLWVTVGLRTSMKSDC